MDNFKFLGKYWPSLNELGSLAEVYVYEDPNTCIFKLGQICEIIVREICRLENISIDSHSTHQNNINILKRHGLISSQIDDILFSLRRARNNAVHTGSQSISDAMTLLEMTHTLSIWFMEVYGDWEFEKPVFKEPVKIEEDYSSLKNKIDQQETLLNKLLEKFDEVETLASTKSYEEKQEKVIEAESNIELTENILDFLEEEKIRVNISTLPTVNFVLEQNGINIIRELSIINNTENILEDLVLSLTVDAGFVQDVEYTISEVKADNFLDINDLKLEADVNYLIQLTERVNGSLTVTLKSDEGTLYEESIEISALPFDQWQGINYMPELLASYVTPNHPDISNIILEASDILKEWKIESSMEGYQSKSKERVISQLSAVFAALKNLNLVYASAPPSFEEQGQRIRLVNQVLEKRIGNCLDLTLLFASVLEALGLHPILITQPGHIFLGVWLEDISFPEIVEEDITMLSKRVASGIDEILVLETTLLASNSSATFDDAVRKGMHNLEEDSVDFIIDVNRARLSKIRPLPLRTKNSEGIVSLLEDRKLDIDPKKTSIVLSQVEIDEEEKQKQTKIGQWERKLLDLSLRNNLINMRLTRSLIPLLSHSLDELEDSLAKGRIFSIGAKPNEWHIRQDDLSFNNSNDLGDFEGIIKSEMKNKKLRAFLPEQDLENRMKLLYRNARLSLEENGANTLFMAFGLLKWYETSKSEMPRFAPIILLPIELRRRSGSNSYSIRIRDEESQMNITLLEKLKQDFGIDITGLDPLPLDDDGVDIRKVFTIIRKGIKNQSRWDLVESNHIGIFSFSQFVMWNDLRNRRSILEENKIVNSLINGKLTWQPEYSNKYDYNDIEDSVLQPLPADSSQLTAIQNSIDGKSFVLHGPPGTGKSQTITSLIANNLFHGKTVLFVAEKMAALEVVQKRLTDIGLGDFCLELHSNKANKKDVLQYFENLINSNQYRSVESYDKKLSELSRLRKELNQYSIELHNKHDNGFTIYELINEYEVYKDYGEISNFTVEELNSFNKETKFDQEIYINQLVASARETVHPKNNPLASVNLDEYRQSLRSDTEFQIDELSRSLHKFSILLEKINEEVKYRSSPTLADLKSLKKLLENLSYWESFPIRWKETDNLNYNLLGIKELSENKIVINNMYNDISSKWNKDFFSLDSTMLYMQLNTANAQWFLPKMFAISKIKKPLKMLNMSNELSNDYLYKEVKNLKEYHDLERTNKELIAQYGDYLGDYYQGSNTIWENIITKVELALKSSVEINNIDKSGSFRKNNVSNSSIYPLIEPFTNALTDVEENYDKLKSILMLNDYEEENWVPYQIKFMQIIKDNIMNLREWVIWNEHKNNAEKYNLINLVKAYEEGAKHEDILPMFRKKITMQLSSMMIDKVEVLNKFNGSLFNSKVKQFKDIDKEISKISKIELDYKLKSNLPDFKLPSIGKSEIAILKRAIASKGRGTSIRRLFSQIPTLLPRVAPCMLMSPISAAQYLDPSQPLFDLVVFDEASQLPTAKAVGTIARAENAIIVGDPKQMPPTNFFATNKVDEDNIDLEDLESILDDASAISLPEEHLQWHYRSKHESLISFSNAHFYDNKLYTFPSFNDIKSKVSFKYVKGMFERGGKRHNLEEAKAIVAELFSRFQDESLRELSIGVVTFNTNQQDLIEDLIIKKSIENPEFDKWINSQEERLFVKNLENVQGDERDVILFSIGFGPDQEGKIHMNFGPLNRDGGWRRLNVAITRSRYEMIVFSSLFPENIDLSRTSSEGVAALRKFLEYAFDNSKLQLAEQTNTEVYENTFGIAESIAESIRKEGYVVDLNIGKSEFKVDIAIRNPKDPDNYILGILLDGQAYYGAKTTRDREVSHEAVLTMLGWKVHRLWSLDWRENSEKELKIIIDLIESNKDVPKVNINKADDVKIDIAVKKINTKKVYGAAEYKQSKLTLNRQSSEDFLTRINIRTQRKSRLLKIVDIEGPIYKDVAFRKLVNSYGISRLGVRIEDDLNKMLKTTSIHRVKEGDREVLWSSESKSTNDTNFREYNVNEERKVVDVPLREISNALIYVLENYITLSHDDLLRESASILGFKRVTKLVRDHFNIAIKNSILAKKIVASNEETYILPEE